AGPAAATMSEMPPALHHRPGNPGRVHVRVNPGDIDDQRAVQPAQPPPIRLDLHRGADTAAHRRPPPPPSSFAAVGAAGPASSIACWRSAAALIPGIVVSNPTSNPHAAVARFA